jgi:hypothetical protein
MNWSLVQVAEKYNTKHQSNVCHMHWIINLLTVNHTHTYDFFSSSFLNKKQNKIGLFVVRGDAQKGLVTVFSSLKKFPMVCSAISSSFATEASGDCDFSLIG